MPRARVLAACAAVVLVAGSAGCANSGTVASARPHTGTSTATPDDGVYQVTITTGNDLRFHPSTIIVPSHRRVRIVLRNTEKPGAGPPHNLVVDGLAGGVPYVDAGQTLSWEFVTPAPGRYRFVCQLHEEQGQTGTMIVTRSGG